MPTAEIRVEGLDQLRRDMRKISRQARNEWDKELRGIGRPIAARAKEAYRREHPRKRRRGRRASGAQRAIRSSARRGASVLILGSGRIPFLAGQEFGGSQPQFPSYDRRGRFFWPEIIRGREEAFKRLVEAIDRINDRYFRRSG